MSRTLHLASADAQELGRLLHQSPGDEMNAWLDLDTGEVIASTSLYGLDPDAPPDEPPPPLRRDAALTWQEEEEALVRRVLADTSGRYLAVPVGADFGQPGVLSEFARGLTDAKLREEVRGEMRGAGAFRRVKSLLERRGEIDLWYTFEAERDIAAVREWLAEHEVELVVKR